MTDEELLDSILGLMAYDHGCTDSGIHDDALKIWIGTADDLP